MRLATANTVISSVAVITFVVMMSDAFNISGTAFGSLSFSPVRTRSDVILVNHEPSRNDICVAPDAHSRAARKPRLQLSADLMIMGAYGHSR